MDRLRGRVILITGSTGIAAATAVRCGAEGASVFIVSRTADHAAGPRGAGRRDRGGVRLGRRRPDPEARDRCRGRGGRRALRSDRWLLLGRRRERPTVRRRPHPHRDRRGLGGDGRTSTCAPRSWPAPVSSGRCAAQAPNDGGTRGSILLLGSVTTRQRRSRSCSGPTRTRPPRGRLTALMTTMAATYAGPGSGSTSSPRHSPPRRWRPRAATDPHILEYARRKQPLAGEMLDPDEVAQAAIYFLSDESRAVTGQSLAVDGGWSVISTTADRRRHDDRLARSSPMSTSASSAPGPRARPRRSPPHAPAPRSCSSIGCRSSAARARPSSTRSTASTRRARSRARSSAGSATTWSPRCASLGPVLERPNTYGAGTGVTYLADHLKVAWERLASEAGVRILLHAMLQDVEVRDGRVGRRSSSRRGPASRACARRPSSTPPATRTCARSPGSGSRRPARSIRPRP